MQNLITAFLTRPLGRIIALGGFYWLFGKLALMLSIHPASPVPVWPASGLALVGLLLWGPSVWPGIFAGAMMLGLDDLLRAATMAERLETVLIYAALGVAATFQALLGRALVTRYAGFPSPMDRLRFLTMLILAGPVACLINATVGVAAFTLTGKLASGMGITWGVWWFSDLIGVMTVLIVVSAWMAEMGDASPRIRWLAIVSALVVMAVAMGSFGLFRDRSRKIARGEFDRQAALITQTIRHKMDSYVDVLLAIERLFYASGAVDRLAFARFVQPFLERHHGIQALEWVPKVTHDERPACEALAKSDGFGTFELTERSDGSLVRATDRDLYYPVYYLVPYRGNERALGFDLGSNPVRLNALERAMALAEPTVSGRLELVQETAKQFGFLVFVPVYREEVETRSAAERHESLRGFALGVFRIGDMMSDALMNFDMTQTAGRIDDIAAPAGEKRLWETTRGTAHFDLRLGRLPEPEYTITAPITNHGRNWVLSLWPISGCIQGERFLNLWASAAGGLLFGSGICAFLFTLLGRTEALFRVNASMNQEVMERQAAENSLRRVQQRLTFILNTSPTVTYIARVDGDFGATFISNNVEALCGYPALRFTADASFWAEHIHDQDRERVLRDSAGILERGEMETDYRFRHANGGTLWVHDQARLVRDGQGNPLEIIGNWGDVTDRMTAVTALRASEERFSVAFKCNPGAMAILSLADQTFFDINDSFMEMFGVRREELIGKSPEALRLFADDTFIYTMMARVTPKSNMDFCTTGRVYARETGFRRGTGETGTCLFSSSVMTIEQQPSLLIVLYDITRRNRAEEEQRSLEKKLRQSQKLEAIGTLAGGIAHDFNNILSVIIGYSELALEAATDPELQSDLNEVLRAGQRARDLIGQILAFSRQSEQEMRPIRLKLIVGEVLTLLKASLPSYIVIRQHIECDARILGDPIQIHQVLMNLCTNAGHAMPDGGTLEVELKVCPQDQVLTRSDDLRAEACVELTVRDTGQGMTPEVISRIFEPYFTTKKKGDGTGLGLSVVHGIVKRLGGDIRVESAPGRGSTFHVFFPLLHEAEEEEIKEIKTLPGGTERILFVDDEPTLAEMAKRLLESLGYRVTIRTSSLEALELFKCQPDKFDLLITDMTMPHMTGEFLIEAALRIRPGFPAIICTGFSERIDEKKAKQFGAMAYVLKPILKHEIAEIIRKVLDG